MKKEYEDLQRFLIHNIFVSELNGNKAEFKKPSDFGVPKTVLD